VIKKLNKSMTSYKTTRSTKLPARELARFIRRLSFLYRDPIAGNIPLSNSLAELADQLSRPVPDSNFVTERGELRKRSLSSQKRKGHFGTLDSRAIEKLLQSPTITKMNLIQLGGERFSIPRAKLMKLTLDDAIEAIRAALRNEESLKIISREAERGGTTRSS
jgi:hypothetical protein